MKREWRVFGSDESGSIAVVASLGLVLILGIAAIVVDLGHLYVVRQEMQTAAEAGAYAGARALTLPEGSTDLQWDNGNTAATSTVQQNSADNIKLADFNSDQSVQKVQTGYWDMRWTRETAPENLNGYLDPSAYTPVDPLNEVPAVKVIIAKVQGANGAGAPVSSYFASLWGISSSNLQTTAVATAPCPGSVGAGNVLPLATPLAFVDQYWKTNHSFRIYSDYHVEDQTDGTIIPYGGQWTSFLVDSNSAATAKGLVQDGNPTPLKINDEIYIQPGTKASVYGAVGDYRMNQIVLLAVVDNDFNIKSKVPIKAFVAFQITGYSQGAKYVEGHFVQTSSPVTGGGGSGPDYGVHLSPRLVE